MQPCKFLYRRLLSLSLLFLLTACPGPGGSSGEVLEELTDKESEEQDVQDDEISTDEMQDTMIFNSSLFDNIEILPYPSVSPSTEYQKLLVLHHSDDTEIYKQTVRAFSDARLNYSTLDIKEPAALSEMDEKIDKLKSHDILVMATQYGWVLTTEQTEHVVQYIQDGGSAVFLIYDNTDGIHDAVGIQSNSYDWQSVSGLCIEKPFFPGMDDIELDGSFLTSSCCQPVIKPEVQVLATAQGKPQAWTYAYGSGHVVYVNSSMLQSSSMRGLLLQLVSLAGDYFLSTIQNAGLMQIDDFPSSIKDQPSDAIWDQYGRTDADFIEKIWWPDIKTIGEELGFKYTCLAIGNYENRTDTPLYKISEEDRTSLEIHGNLLKGCDVELGIHGYNHVSLIENSTTHWKRKSDMVDGLFDMRNVMEDIFKSTEYFSYVAPMNCMDNTGKQALMDVFPEITSLGGLFTDSTDPNVLKQEMERDPDLYTVYSLPRFSSGYAFGSSTLWQIYNGLACAGVFSHFIHPDDPMDPGRNHGMTWSALYSDFSENLRNVFSNHPWIRQMTNAQLTKIRLKQEGLKVYSSREGENITIRYSRGAGPVYHYLRLNRGEKVDSVSGGKATVIQKSSGLYLIEGRSPSLTIHVK